MSELSIFEKSQEIRFETQQYANTRERVANVLDDINDTKANKEDVAIAIQAVLDELGLTEQELYAYIDEIKLDLDKKMDKPFWAGYEQHYFVISSNGTSNLRPITLAANQLPYWAGNTFFNSNIYTTGGGNIGIGTSAPTERFEVNGNLKANAIYLPVNSTSPVAYKLRSDGSFLYYTDGNSLENRLAYESDIKNIAIANLTTTGARTFTQAHAFTWATGGNSFNITGLIDKSSDGNYLKILAINDSTGEVVKRDIFEANVRTLTSNTTLDNTYNGSIIRLSGANFTVTIPQGLKSNFEVYFENITTGNAYTILFAGGVSNSAPFGKVIPPNGRAVMYAVSQNNFRLTGNLIP